MWWVYGKSSNSDPGAKMVNLQEKKSQLMAREADVRTEIENAEIQPGKIRREEVAHWLATVEKKNSEVQSIKEEVQKQGFVSSQLMSRIEKATKDVQELIQDGKFPKVVLDDCKSRALQFPATRIVGEMFEHNLKKLLGWLEGEGSFLIGAYGMGGVGKTTLLKCIHNNLLANPKFGCHVYWVTVSQECSMCMLQGKIAHAVTGEKDLDEECEERRAAKLHRIFRDMGKTVLILDDLWEPFMLDKIGIPTGENSCKVILSTRSLEVCRRMGCQEEFVVKVETLSASDAWELFVKKLQNYEALSTEVKQRARSVAEECGRLPLAIITIAATMRGIIDMQEWSNALSELKNPSRLQHDTEKIFDKLKFSYDRLNDELMKHCFLSCLLYCEDENIHREELIQAWRTEGLLDEIEKHEQMNKGHTILNKLENLCLLELTTYYGEKYVKMHDLIRDMGIKITQRHPRFMAKAGLLLKEVPKEEQWSEDLIKVSLRFNRINMLPLDMSPKCPKLSVLLLTCNWNLKGIPEYFFVHMRSLTVLDLSWTDIERVPASVSNLENLRGLLLEGCGELMNVPSLEKLTKLKVLRLPKFGALQKVPEGMGNLKSLEKMSYCSWKKSELSYFNKLMKSWRIETPYHYRLGRNKWSCFDEPTYVEDEDGDDREVEIVGIEIGEELGLVLPATVEILDIRECEVKGRGSLEDICPSFGDTAHLEALIIMKCSGLLEYIWSGFAKQQQLSIAPQLETLTLMTLPELQGLIKARPWCESSSSLESVAVSMFPQPIATFSNLKNLTIYACPEIKFVFPVELWQHHPLLPNLETIYLWGCTKLEVIFESPGPSSNSGSGSGTNLQILALSNLKTMYLDYLPRLGSIYNGLFVCTHLEYSEISACPEIDSDSEEWESKNMVLVSELPLMIAADLRWIPREADNREWWESLHRDYPEAASKLSNSWKHRGLEYIWSGSDAQLDSSISVPALETIEELYIREFPDLRRLINATTDGFEETTAVSPVVSATPQLSADTFSHLKKLSISNCRQIKAVFPVELVEHQPILPTLEMISVKNCQKVEVIFASPRPSPQILALPSLKQLELEQLLELGSIYDGLLLCTRLESINIEKCPKIEAGVSLSKPLIYNTCHSSLSSIPMVADSPEWWEPLRHHYPVHGFALACLFNLFQQENLLDVPLPHDNDQDQPLPCGGLKLTYSDNQFQQEQLMPLDGPLSHDHDQYQLFSGDAFDHSYLVHESQHEEQITMWDQFLPHYNDQGLPLFSDALDLSYWDQDQHQNCQRKRKWEACL